MTSFLGGLDVSILTIPVFHIMSILPHTYAVSVQGKHWDNRNPRSNDYKETLKEKLGPETFAHYERAESASANAFENIPLYAAAVIVGNMAGLKQEGIDGMNGFAGMFLATRALHTFLYLNGTTDGVALARTGAYFASVAMAVRVFYKAAVAMGSKGLAL